VKFYDILQAFSHYTYEATSGELLVCDLQGVFEPDHVDSTSGRPQPLFRLTDPVIHDVSSSKLRAAEDGWGRRKVSETAGGEVEGSKAAQQQRHGRTDRRQQGIADFFETHRCNAVCRALRLTKGSDVRHELQKSISSIGAAGDG